MEHDLLKKIYVINSVLEKKYQPVERGLESIPIKH